MNCFLFYPENDVALAAGLRNFTAPKHASELRRQCGFLLEWIAEEDDSVIYDSTDSRWEHAMIERHSLPDKRPATDAEPCPWGWSFPSRKILVANGIAESKLPTDSQIEILRQLSHRRCSLVLLKSLARRGIHIPQLPVEVTDAADLKLLLAGGGRLMVKAPWSSSGRGLIDTGMLNAGEVLRRAEGVIRRQGSVLVEQFLNDVCDFAMLFRIDGGRASFAGYSMFSTRGIGAYTGNLVAGQKMMQSRLGQYIAAESLDKVKLALEHSLSELIGRTYNGYLGVDMMIYRDLHGELRLNPCVELNLRMTMGVVALKLAEKWLAPASQGELISIIKITGNSSAETVPAQSPQFENGRLVSGTLHLTPPSAPDFGFCLVATPSTR